MLLFVFGVLCCCVVFLCLNVILDVDLPCIVGGLSVQSNFKTKIRTKKKFFFWPFVVFADGP